MYMALLVDIIQNPPSLSFGSSQWLESDVWTETWQKHLAELSSLDTEHLWKMAQDKRWECYKNS